MTRIIGDTTCGMTLDKANAIGIDYIPQIIVFGEKTFRDDTEIDSMTFVKMLSEAPELPKTAAPPPALYNPIYDKLRENKEGAIVICPSSALSGTVRSAETALADYPDIDVRIIDTRTIGGSMASMLIEAKRLADEGKSIDEIEASIRDMVSRARLYAVVDTLEYLYKGGRISGTTKVFGDLLQMKPILSVNDGKVEAFDKQRTKKRALARLVELVGGDIAKDPKKGLLSFCTLEEGTEIKFLREEFKNKYGIEEVPYYNVPPAIMVHAGPGVIIANFFID